MRTRIFATAMIAVWLSACGGGSGQGLDAAGRPVDGTTPTNPGADPASFESIQANVLTPICIVCHAGGGAPVGLRLDSANAYAMLVGVESVEVPGLLRVAPGDPDNSYLIQKLEGTASVGAQMPLGGPPLDGATIASIRQWISDGALPPGSSNPPATAPKVTSVDPENDAVVTTALTQLTAGFDQPMDASLFSDLTFTLTASGGDGTFGDGNEVVVTPLAVTLVNAQSASFDLTGVALVDDVYEARLVASGATALAGTNGEVLDGDGDGIAGGDFSWRFTLAVLANAPQPTWRWIQDNVYTTVCTQCHVQGGIADFMLLDEQNSFVDTVNVLSTEVPSLNRITPADPDNSYLVQKIEGTAAVGDRMPLGGQPLAPEVIDAIRAWIAAGVPLEPGDPMPPAPDIEAPSIVIDAVPSPASGLLEVGLTATDNVGVSEVRLYVDGLLAGTDTAPPFAVSWDTTTVPDGAYLLTAEAEDAAGNVGMAGAVEVSVANVAGDLTPPMVSIVALPDPVAGAVTVTVAATDNVAVASVELRVDGVALGTRTVAPYQFQWDTTLFADGVHTLQATATDSNGNSAVSDAINVTVDNTLPPDTTAPVVAITTPPSPLAGIVTFEIDAADDTAVSVVRVYVDELLIGSATVAPYLVSWDSTLVADGAHTVRAEADDTAGNVGNSDGVMVTVQNSAGPQPTWRWIQDNVFTTRCVACHVQGGIADFLWLTEADSYGQLVDAPTTEGGPPFRVLPGDPDNSSLVQRLEGTLSPQMPLGAAPLSPEEIQAVRQWILDGAPPEVPPDDIPPSVALVPPGNTVSGVITLTAQASDNAGIAAVRFYIDGALAGSDTTAPYQYIWDTGAVANGSYQLTAEADDIAGNTSVSAPVTVMVDNTLPGDTTPPVVSVQPPAGTLSGSVTVSIDASDDVGVTGVSLSVDGTQIGTTTIAPYTIQWDTLSVANGQHELVATATDAAGNVGTSAPVIVTVDNGPPPDTTAPVVALTMPPDPVSGTIMFEILASDNVGVTTTRVFVDNVLVGTATVAPYLVSWDSTLVNDGMHSVRAEAEDAAGNVGASDTVTITVRNTAGPEPTWRWIQDNVFTTRCVACHVQGGIADFLWLTEADSYGQLVDAPTTEGGPPFRVLPGDPDNSSLVQRLEGTLSPQMPLGGAPLSPDEIQAVRQWIADGALPELPPDTGPPTVSVVSPGTTVSGSIVITVEASDDTGVSAVRFYVNGVLTGSDTTAPYQFTWDTVAVANGSYQLSAEADDIAGNTSVSAPVTVIVDNTLPGDTTPPVVSIQSPAGTLSATVTVAIDASDDVGVTGVSLSVDGTQIGTTTTSPYTIQWDTLSVANGQHELVATATDAAGNVGTSAAVIVTVDNGDTTAPVVTLATPPDPVSGTIMFEVLASDNVGVTITRVFVDNALVGTATVAPYLVSWDSTLVIDGMHTVRAEAEDAAGNVGASDIVTITVQNTAGPQPTWRWIQDNVFTPRCVVCHVQGGAADFLWLTEAASYDQLVNAPTTEGGPPFRVLPGDPDNSSLVQRLEGTLSPQMPLGGAPLAPDELAAVRQWIAGGALPEPPPDTGPPTVSVVSPGATVSGSIVITVEANDDTGVTAVRFYVDGVLAGSDTTAPYQFQWDTGLVADGSHQLSAEADDAAGNTTVSMPVTVMVDNTLPGDTTPPQVSIQPPAGTLSGSVTVAIDASDDVGVTGVSLAVDGNQIGTTTTSPYTIDWDTLTVNNGQHELVATATDAAGNIGTSAPVTVTVANTEPVITIQIDAPANVVRGDEFSLVATVGNGGAESGELTATLSFTPENLLRIRDGEPTQPIGVLPPMGEFPVSWLMRGDDVGTAQVTVTVTDITGTVDVSETVTIVVVD